MTTFSEIPNNQGVPGKRAPKRRATCHECGARVNVRASGQIGLHDRKGMSFNNVCIAFTRGDLARTGGG